MRGNVQSAASSPHRQAGSSFERGDCLHHQRIAGDPIEAVARDQPHALVVTAHRLSVHAPSGPAAVSGDEHKIGPQVSLSISPVAQLSWYDPDRGLPGGWKAAEKTVLTKDRFRGSD
jgi:hypothetical protein